MLIAFALSIVHNLKTSNAMLYIEPAITDCSKLRKRTKKELDLNEI